MIKVYTGYKGFFVFLLFTASVILILSLFSWGVAKIILFLKPCLICISDLMIIVFSLGFLPASYIKDLRPLLAKYSLWMSYALGISTWIISLFLVLRAFGFLGLFFVFLFKFMAPVALAGALIKGAWHDAGHLALWIGFTYGMKYYSQWVLNLDTRHQGQGRIIDVQAVEIEKS